MGPAIVEGFTPSKNWPDREFATGFGLIKPVGLPDHRNSVDPKIELPPEGITLTVSVMTLSVSDDIETNRRAEQ